MSVKYVVGDLVVAAKAGELDAIAHGCNCFNTMKSGIAPLIAKAFPKAFEADQGTVKGDKSKLGSLSPAWQEGILICNLYSQYNYTGRRQGKMDLNYEALDKSLSRFQAYIINEARVKGAWKHQMRVGIPKIGAGLAGGDWELIYPIIEKNLAIFDTRVYVLKVEDVP